MPEPPIHNRREFLTGRAARDAAASLLPEALPLPAPAHASEAYTLRYAKRAMACQFELLVAAGRYDQGTEAALSVFELLDALEAQMTVYRPDSEIMHVNRAAADGPVRVERQLLQLLSRALRIHRETSGAFDITSGALSKVWGFSRRQGAIPESSELDGALERVGSQHVELKEEGGTVAFRREGLEINLGSIGKGYALDRCAEYLEQQGLHDFLWHGGQSSVLARGDAPGQAGGGWLIGVGDQLHPGRRLAQVRLHDRALATSGIGAQSFRHAGKRYGHILDPRTGWPAEGLVSTTVVAPTAAEADALSTACFVLGREGALEFCGRRPELGLLVVTAPCAGKGAEVESVGLDEELEWMTSD